MVLLSLLCMNKILIYGFIYKEIIASNVYICMYITQHTVWCKVSMESERERINEKKIAN